MGVADDTEPDAQRARCRWLGTGGAGWCVIGLMAISVVGHVLILMRDLPIPDMDEPVFVRRAVEIAASDDWNPHWFGHPGSTVIYPLAVIYRAWYAITNTGSLVGPNAGLLRWYAHEHTLVYTLGRLWVVLLAVGSIPLVYLVGRRAFSSAVGLIGALLWALVPLAMHYGSSVRTDSAGVFFGLCALLGCLHVLDRPSLRNEVLTGAAIGLAVASRWFFVAALPIFVVAHVVSRARVAPVVVRWRVLAAGFTCALVVFVLASPYVLLDLSEVERSLQRENLSGVGHEGFNFAGNLRWYLGRALPATLTWGIALSAVAGVTFILVRRRRAEPLLLLLFSGVFLLGLCFSKLHWDRWILPIVPILTLCAAYGAEQAAHACARRRDTKTSARPALGMFVALAALLLAVLPAHALVQLERREARPSTRTLAQRWLRAHVSHGAKIVEEFDTAPLSGRGVHSDWRYTLVPGLSAASYLQRYRYIVINGDLNQAFFAHPKRYSRKIAFYRSVYVHSTLIKSFHPTSQRSGPRILIYEVNEADKNSRM